MTRNLAALALTPFTAASVFAASTLFFTALTRHQAGLPLLAGAAVYCLLHFSRAGNRYFYVLAHELSHALAALISGVKIRKISIRRNSGYVSMNATSTFISLAPYFIPFYAMAAGLAYGLASFFTDMSPWRPLFTGLTGFLLAFHLLNTGEILTGPLQSDLKKAGGLLFAFSLVLLLNSLALVVALKLIFPDLVSLRGYAGDVWELTARISVRIGEAVSYCVRLARQV